MSEGKSFRHLLFDTSLIIGIITVFAYFEGTLYYKNQWDFILPSMIPEISVKDIFFHGGLNLLVIMSFIIAGIAVFRLRHGSFKIGIINKSKELDIILLILSILILLLIIIVFPFISRYIETKYPLLEQNEVTEIKLKYEEKIENITHLIFLGRKDDFYIFLKENREVISFNKNEIQMIKLKN